MSPAEPVTPSLCRVALLVGEDFEVDYSLPAGVALIAVTEDLVARVTEVLRERSWTRSRKCVERRLRTSTRESPRIFWA